MAFHNNPELRSENGEVRVKRYVHQPLENDHYGIHFKILENGHVVVRSKPTPIKGTDEMEYDQVEFPASLVFKLVQLLKATRKEVFVTVTEAAKLPAE